MTQMHEALNHWTYDLNWLTGALREARARG
jgi:hypothetical protein